MASFYLKNRGKIITSILLWFIAGLILINDDTSNTIQSVDKLVLIEGNLVDAWKDWIEYEDHRKELLVFKLDNYPETYFVSRTILINDRLKVELKKTEPPYRLEFYVEKEEFESDSDEVHDGYGMVLNGKTLATNEEKFAKNNKKRNSKISFAAIAIGISLILYLPKLW